MGIALAHYLVRRFKLDLDELEEDDDSSLYLSLLEV